MKRQSALHKNAYFSVAEETPNQVLKEILEQAELEREQGKIKRFDGIEEAIDYLDGLTE